MIAVHKVHASYIEQDTRGWLAACGGRCYRREDVVRGFHEMELCPACPPDETKSWMGEAGGLRVAFSREAHVGMSDYVAATSLSRLTCFTPYALLSEMLHMKELC